MIKIKMYDGEWELEINETLIFKNRNDMEDVLNEILDYKEKYKEF